MVLTQPLGYVKKPTRMMPAIRWSLRKYPLMVEAMARRHEMYNAQLRYVAEAEKEGRCLVIRPDAALPIGHLCHDAEQMQQVHALGCEVARRRIDEIKNFLSAALK